MMTDDDVRTLIVLERMDYHLKKMENSTYEKRIANGYAHIISMLSSDDIMVFQNLMDLLSEDYSERNEYCYRCGLEDGVKLDKLIQLWKDKQ